MYPGTRRNAANQQLSLDATTSRYMDGKPCCWCSIGRTDIDMRGSCTWTIRSWLPQSLPRLVHLDDCSVMAKDQTNRLMH